MSVGRPGPSRHADVCCTLHEFLAVDQAHAEVEAALECVDASAGQIHAPAVPEGGGDDDRLKDRFRVFCFKYDLEVLILASEEALKTRLGIDHLEVTWQIPVEDQDHDQPPKKIVETLFKEYGIRYKGTADAPLILGQSNYLDIADKCPQCFKPFVDFLTSLRPTSYD